MTLAVVIRPDAVSVLCGVTRVGLVAKGLLIKGDMDLELVLMCREKPTKLLLYTISANLPLQIQVQSVHSASTMSHESSPGFKKHQCDPSFSETPLEALHVIKVCDIGEKTR